MRESAYSLRGFAQTSEDISCRTPKLRGGLMVHRISQAKAQPEFLKE